MLQCVFLLSQCMFFTSVLHVFPACFLLLSCMLVTSLLHVILVVVTHYFSRIYQSSLFLCSRSPSHPCFHTVHLNAITACTAVLHLHSPWIHHPSNVYALPLSTPFFRSVLLVASYFIYSVDWSGQRNVLVRSFFYDGQCMFPITYHCCFSITIPNLLFPVICISMSIWSIMNSSSMFLIITS